MYKNSKADWQKGSYKLVLFDIDGTLISTGRAGTRAMNMAFYEMFGIENGFQHVKMAGRTDPAIIRDGMRLAGVSSPNGEYEKYRALYLEHLAREMKTSVNKHLMPGIGEILENLKADSGPTVGLLTGNMEEGARIKLEDMGIMHHFFLGAYGSDNDDRNRLLHVALERWRNLKGRSIEPAEVMVIGDTPHDIECSKPFGATAVAVATGPYSIEELSSHGPDHIFSDLGDPEEFLKLVR